MTTDTMPTEMLTEAWSALAEAWRTSSSVWPDEWPEVPAALTMLAPRHCDADFVRIAVFESPRSASPTWWRWQDDLINLLLGALRTAPAEITRWGHR